MAEKLARVERNEDGSYDVISTINGDAFFTHGDYGACHGSCDRINSAADSWAQSREKVAVEAFRERCARVCEEGWPISPDGSPVALEVIPQPKLAAVIRSLPAGTEGKEDGHAKA